MAVVPQACSRGGASAVVQGCHLSGLSVALGCVSQKHLHLGYIVAKTPERGKCAIHDFPSLVNVQVMPCRFGASQ